ncbi:hypothetical protein JOF53_000218 [Crossiella equi]|uniref:Alpha/beta hydrolase n=1 Tax=Crossiella equi TaxID=130796 RepID=A0ABS5A445_9PSEU|nr:hypothetical protein [Crossiella equi]MBP2471346.1 hypothetical protein [Crossiella equi]
MRRWAALPVDCRVVVVDQAGHVVCGDTPERCSDLVLGLVTAQEPVG